MTVKKPGL